MNAPAATPTLPDDQMLKLAAQSMFDVFASTAMGSMLVDRQHRIVWISDSYKQFLPALGFDSADAFVGKRVEEVVPNSLMAQVIDTGQPILVDLLSNQAGTFLVSRLPLRNAAGEVIGAFGMVLLDHPETTMLPLVVKFARLQQQLDAARQQLAEQRRPKYRIASFIGTSAAAVEAKRQARRVALTDSTVLLLGETGTGKELLAHGIHAASARAGKPFVGVNIAAVPESLLEAEFFGVAPGAFTGAERKGRDGKFKAAHGGTLLLDEIGDMPLALQSKLLRVLQEQELEPLGSNQLQRIDVRVIAATSRDLAAMVAAGTFRADLYYRLNVLPIRLPPLRERLDDLEALVEALAEDISRRSGLPHKSLNADALELLARHRWPGNIRELRNVLEQATLMTDDLLLTAAHFSSLAASGSARGTPAIEAGDVAAGALAALAASAAPAALAHAAPAAPVASSAVSVAPTTSPASCAATALATPVIDAMAGAARFVPLPQAVAALEAAAIRRALQHTHGNKLAAARLLGISRATLYQKLPLVEAMAGQVAGGHPAASPHNAQPTSGIAGSPTQGD